MEKLTSKEIREKWLDYFSNNGHEIIESKSLVPINDPSLLWINSGVATLKDYFTGKTLPKNPKITNSQKCIRTNDIENVGITSRHHTFFEMLGNFSIGAYFKKEAIKMAYDVIFDVYGFEKNKIYITYFKEDEYTYNMWIELGINPSNLISGNRETNFWDIGQGPCGPCTEIFFDRGVKFDPKNIGLKLLQDDLENDRYIEIWNIVFSQFNNNGEKKYEELKQKNIDTGAGLERIASILQNVPTNFETDLFMPIINKIEDMSGKKYDINNYFINEKKQTYLNKQIRVIADHMRAVVIAIQDGARPSNTQRGYVIRRLIRRSYRTGMQIGIKQRIFLSDLIPSIMEALPWYSFNIEKIKQIIVKEEKSFSQTINQGEKILISELKNTKDEFDSKIAFKLFETYGYPFELTQEIVEEQKIKINRNKFDILMKEHAHKSKGKASKGLDQQNQIIQKINEHVSEFTGYEETKRNSNIIFEGEENNKKYVLLDKTPFYATKGGQLHDWGYLNDSKVLNVFRDKYENHWHIVDKKIGIKKVKANVDENLRLKKERNHTGTHLLGLALTKVFGKNTIQLGSDNNEDRLRLDFNLDNKPTKKQLHEIEDVVNNLIKKSINREYKLMEYNVAIDYGVLSLEGEDYGNGLLRVVEFGESKEFCGGTHIKNTIFLEKFKIVKIDTKGSGIYRIEAITSYEEINNYNKLQEEKIINKIQSKINKNKLFDSSYSMKINGSIKELEIILEKVIQDNKQLKKKQKHNPKIDFDIIDFIEWNGKKTFIDMKFKNPKYIKTFVIALREKFSDALIIIGAPNKNKTTLCVGSIKYNSKKIFDEIAFNHNGRGGGNDNIAMGSIDLIEEL